MSRYIDYVAKEKAEQVFGNLEEHGVPDRDTVAIAHGYDRLDVYFCDFDYSEDDFGICYGNFPISTVQKTKEEYIEAMEILGLQKAKAAVIAGIPY